MSEMERAKEIDDAVKAADAKKRADAEAAAVSGSKLDQILDCLASRPHGRLRQGARRKRRR
jgi:hypothetical protein